jgi:hypothetical protein
MRETDYDTPELFRPTPSKTDGKATDIAGTRTGSYLPFTAGDKTDTLTDNQNTPAKRKKPWWSLPLRLLIRIGGSDRLESLLPKALRTPLQ